MFVFVSVYLLFVPLVYCIFVLLLAAVRNIGLNHSKGNLELLRNKFKRKEDVGNMVSEFAFLLLPKVHNFCRLFMQNVLALSSNKVV